MYYLSLQKLNCCEDFFMNQFIILASLTFSLNAFSAETKTQEVASYPVANDVRCEKIIGSSLADFKAKLVENCDLNKPFSSSLSRLLNEETYFYCCQLKK